MKYKEYKNLNYARVGEDILEYWKKHNIFQKSVDIKEGNPAFTFYEGPPSANGTPGIHHVMARTVKDIFCRYKTLKGFQVKRKGGWDTHGLPVELQVEKELGITKEDIGKKISVKDYNLKCREAVMKYKDQWDELTEKMGYWVDLEDPYITFETPYVESVWHLLKRLYEKDLLYKGYTIQPYSPAAGTGLSSHELNQPGTYRDVKDTTVVAQFKIKDREDEYFLAWTTTPWTLPSNSALAVGQNISYVKVKTFNPYTFQPVIVILAKDRFGAHFNSKAEDIELEDYQAGDKLIPYKIIEELKGKDLEGIAYEQLLPYVQPENLAFRVILGDFVTTEDGTGIVHIAPTFGADDQRVAMQAGIPPITIKNEYGEEMPLVNKQGKFVREVTDFAGEYVKSEYEENGVVDKDYKSVDVKIAIKLKEENKAFKVEKYEHNYPHCWRTDKPILYYPLDSWFIKTTAYKEQLVALNNTINWKPESTGSGRFGNWLENLVDWNLSRSRYWGTPLPIWVTEDKKEQKCIGSIGELKEEIQKAIDAGMMKTSPYEGVDDKDIDLHKPYVDDIILVSDSGQKMLREPDLIDVWFDSGAMPYAQWHYPFENNEIFKANYPADFIAEGVDQTRGWFFTLHAIATMLNDSVAFKNVIANGLVLDKNGNKMSKRVGNVVDPFDAISKYGPDTNRWYMISNANPWDNLKFDIEGVVEVQRKFFGTLQNTYAFFALYANLDNFNYKKELPLAKRSESDRWILSVLNNLIKTVDNEYENYEPTKAARAIQDFVTDQLSNWYVRLNRKRFWIGAYNENKEAAYQTLYTCLVTIAKLASPIAPFYTDQLFQDLNAVTQKESKESVHLCDFPKVDESVIDNNLEEKERLAQSVSSLVHSLRKKHKIKVRQPLSKILIPVLTDTFKNKIAAVEGTILNEINVKQIEYVDDTAGIFIKKIKPNFKKLGKEYGPLMKQLNMVISSLQQEDIATFEANESFQVNVEGQQITLTLEDVEISSEDIPGWSVANDGALTVALDINITDDLKEEGLARDLVNRVQNIRKDLNLEVQDKIKIDITTHSEVASQAFENYKDYICQETQALEFNKVNQLEKGTEIELDDITLKVNIEALSYQTEN